MLISSFLAEGGFESQLAYAQIERALGPAQRGSGMLSGLANAMLARSTGTPLSPQLNQAIAGGQVNGQLKQAFNTLPGAAQLDNALKNSPRSSLLSVIHRASAKTHTLGRHALKPTGIRAMQNLAGTVTSVAAPLQPIDATAAPAADPNDPYIIAQAQALNNDPNQIFAFVRDEIGTDVYQGSLRGARGTLWTKAANSLDKASLLIALLGAAGIQANYVHGTLSTTQAQQTIASMFKTPSRVVGCPPPGSALADPVNDPQLQADATDHFWVEFGPDAVPADPSFANASECRAGPDGSRITRYSDVPMARGYPPGSPQI